MSRYGASGALLAFVVVLIVVFPQKPATEQH